MSRSILLSLLLTGLLCILPTGASAQELSADMQELQTICKDLSLGLQAGSDENIRTANEQYRKFRMKHRIGVVSFAAMTPPEDQIRQSGKESGGKYVTFLNSFFDSLLVNDRAYLYSDSLKRVFEARAKGGAVKGGKKSFQFYQKDLVLPASGELIFEIKDKPARFEIIAVAQPYGAFTMYIENLTQGKYYNDSINVTEGDFVRGRAIESKGQSDYRIRLVNQIPKSYSVVIFTN